MDLRGKKLEETSLNPFVMMSFQTVVFLKNFHYLSSESLGFVEVVCSLVTGDYYVCDGQSSNRMKERKKNICLKCLGTLMLYSLFSVSEAVEVGENR